MGPGAVGRKKGVRHEVVHLKEGLKLHLALSVLLVSGLVSSAHAITSRLPDVALRGVAPADLSLYEADPLLCRDNSQQIAVSQLNDDFCDCLDGSDEPGTSACPAGRFYCQNKGYHPVTVFSSRVNDGVCDCCDGGDEWANPGLCHNSCLQAGEAYRTQLAAEAAAYSEGFNVRQKYVKKAKSIRQQWVSELERAKEDKVKQEAKEKALKARKEEFEAAEKAQREWREEQEKAAKAAETPDSAEISAPGPEGAPVPPEAADIPVEGQAEETEAIENGAESEKEDEGATPVEGEADLEKIPLGEENAAEDVDKLSKEELGRRIASRWTHNEEAVGGVQMQAEQKIEDEHNLEMEQELEGEKEENWAEEAREEAESYGEGGLDGGVEEGGDGVEDERDEEQSEVSVGSLLASVTGYIRRVLPKPLARLVFPGPPPEVAATEVESTRAEWSIASSKLSELSSKVSSLESKLARDYGPDDVFAALADECFEVPVNQYKYKVCMFESATQEENAQSVRLGGWAGWLDDYSGFHFTNGQQCWNGPMRSMKVRLRCGPKNKLRNIQEPSRCEYTADLNTPTLCTAEATKAVKEELASAERVAKELKEEL